MIHTYIKQLVEYGIDNGLLESCDRIYTTNILLDMLEMDAYEDPGEVKKIETPSDLEETLKGVLDYALEENIIEEDSVVLKDLFDTKIMNALMPRPGEVIGTFWEKYEKSPKEATEYYYHLSKASDYIRTYRIERDKKWVVSTEYGDIDITINLSKPEKDPKMIALAGTMKSSSYPK